MAHRYDGFALGMAAALAGLAAMDLLVCGAIADPLELSGVSRHENCCTSLLLLVYSRHRSYKVLEPEADTRVYARDGRRWTCWCVARSPTRSISLVPPVCKGVARWPEPYGKAGRHPTRRRDITTGPHYRDQESKRDATLGPTVDSVTPPRKLLHHCFTITRMIQLCSKFR